MFLAAADAEEVTALNIRCRLALAIKWEISGPVKRLGRFNSFQPDPRTLGETASSLKEQVTSDSPKSEGART